MTHLMQLQLLICWRSKSKGGIELTKSCKSVSPCKHNSRNITINWFNSIPINNDARRLYVKQIGMHQYACFCFLFFLLTINALVFISSQSFVNCDGKNDWTCKNPTEIMNVCYALCDCVNECKIKIITYIMMQLAYTISIKTSKIKFHTTHLKDRLEDFFKSFLRDF